MTFSNAWNLYYATVEKPSESKPRAEKVFKARKPDAGLLAHLESLPHPRTSFVGALVAYCVDCADSPPQTPAKKSYPSPTASKPIQTPTAPQKANAAPIAANAFPELDADHDKLIAVYCKNNPISRQRSVTAFVNACPDHATAQLIIAAAQRFAAAKEGWHKTPSIERWLNEKTWEQWPASTATSTSRTVYARMAGMGPTGYGEVSIKAGDEASFEAMSAADKWEYLYSVMGWDRPTSREPDDWAAAMHAKYAAELAEIEAAGV